MITLECIIPWTCVCCHHLDHYHLQLSSEAHNLFKSVVIIFSKENGHTGDIVIIYPLLNYYPIATVQLSQKMAEKGEKQTDKEERMRLTV